MMKTNNLTAILGIALLFSACSKDKDDDKNATPSTTTKTKTELLTAAKWQTTVEKETYVENGETKTDDYYAESEPCDKDDFMQFKTDGTVLFDEGPTKCNVNDEQTDEAQWKFIENDTKLVYTESGYSDTVNVAELSETTLKVTYSYDDNGVIHNGEIAYKNIN